MGVNGARRGTSCLDTSSRTPGRPERRLDQGGSAPVSPYRDARGARPWPRRWRGSAREVLAAATRASIDPQVAGQRAWVLAAATRAPIDPLRSGDDHRRVRAVSRAPRRPQRPTTRVVSAARCCRRRHRARLVACRAATTRASSPPFSALSAAKRVEVHPEHERCDGARGACATHDRARSEARCRPGRSCAAACGPRNSLFAGRISLLLFGGACKVALSTRFAPRWRGAE
jgi:hypothetical protein